MSSAESRVCIIVPAYNEEVNIRPVIEDLRRCHPEFKIVVINDCSEDGTEKAVRELGQTVLNLPVNLGIGGAVQTGLKFARDNGYDIAVQFDGDGQHRAIEIERIITPVINGEADVVIGSRFLSPGNYKGSFSRRLGISVFRFVNSLMVGSRILDNTSGFRAYNRDAISFLARIYPQDYPEPEAVIELHRNRFSIMEVPVVMRERTGGKSSIGVFGSIYYMIKVLLGIMIAFSRKPIPREEPEDG
ncbi:MAG: glycosyltransferase family 2 protein [Candidatus Zixiibacteriota bacterium]|nr:MAG: glycosyltransferase family 2 protein [candidate division Zixibacteria bacterium]